MFRRDYILRHIEEFAAVLAKLTGLTNSEQWAAATAVTAEEFQRLTGLAISDALQMSTTELLAHLIQSGPTHVIETKIFMLATLLKAHGNVLAHQGQAEECRQCNLRGLDLLLEAFGRNGTGERPDFAPTVEAFVIGLEGSQLPLPTSAMLMHHHERMGEFGKAEDVLFRMLEAEPDNPKLLDFGAAFYLRLLDLGDEPLAAGNLPRDEVQAGLEELQQRKRGLA